MNAALTPGEASNDGRTPPTLKTLRPVYDKSKHQVYVDLMLSDLSGDSPSSNIAVSGAYGTGKSSVLTGLLGELKANKIRSMQVTLATLHQSQKAMLEVSGEETLTAALEKEVVKRLLYSATPSDIPRSRFNRISQFSVAPALGLAAAFAVLVVGIAYTFGSNLPPERIAHAWHWWKWTGPVLSLLTVTGLLVALQAALSSFRLSQIAVGPATLSLDDKDGNYFDHYLDEIVYFFQRTKTRVVIFEDLDRFDDVGIFLGLRELNNLLNISPQIAQRVTFVHAIRDSLFVATTKSEGDNGQPLPDAHARHGSDTAASDRAKFFDLIVPLVPFISHEVAADLLLRTLADLPEDLRPSRALITVAGAYFTDMRVLYSIRNEYAVFASELLVKASVGGLVPDQLFAMILYKHLHLDDFERVRTGTSLLDASVDVLRESTLDLLSSLEKSIAEAEDAIELGSAVESRAKAAGTRFLANLTIVVRHHGWRDLQTVTIDDEHAFNADDVSQSAFWVALAKSESPALRLQTPYGPIELPAGEVQALLGVDRNPRAWTRSVAQREAQTHARLLEAREWLRSATFSKLLSGPFPVAKPEGGWAGPSEACLKVLGPGLPYELFRRGYLDQNFALYTTKFHGEILSADARSYLMQYVDRHRSEPLFKLSAADVDEILLRAGDALVNDESALNVAIVDRLLETDARALPVSLEADGHALDFIAIYLSEGKFGEIFLRRLIARRSDLLDVITTVSGISDADRRRLLSVSLSALSGGLEYQMSPTTTEFLARELESLPILQADLEPEVAVAIADLLATQGVSVSDLSKVADPLRKKLADAGCFDITRQSLDAIAPDTGGIGLDTLGGLEDGVGRYLMWNFPEYDAALREEPKTPIVDDPANLDLVVREVMEINSSALPDVLDLLPPGLGYVDLTDAPESAYPVLAEASAFACSRTNISHYIESVGSIDGALAVLLSQTMEVQVGAEEADADEEVARQNLAKLIVTSSELTTPDKVSLVVSLKTVNHLPVAALGLTDPPLAVGLLEAGEIAESLTTFIELASGPWEVFEACAIASSKFPSFVADIPFTDALLASLLTSRVIDDSAKKAVLTQFDTFVSVFGSQSSGPWIAASERLGVQLSIAQATALAGAGAPPAQVLVFVRRNHYRLSAQDVLTLLPFCGAPYSKLAITDGSTFNVPFSDDLRSILQMLKSAGQVRDFHKKRMQALFEVRMVA